LDIRETPGTKSIDKSMSLFGGNLRISQKASSKSIKNGWYSIISTSALVVSYIWAAKI
jgi:hypothetical protein